MCLFQVYKDFISFDLFWSNYEKSQINLYQKYNSHFT